MSVISPYIYIGTNETYIDIFYGFLLLLPLIFIGPFAVWFSLRIAVSFIKLFTK